MDQPTQELQLGVERSVEAQQCLRERLRVLSLLGEDEGPGLKDQPYRPRGPFDRAKPAVLSRAA